MCASVVAGTVNEGIRLVERAEREGADLLELRADYLKSLERLGDVAESSRLPFILTIRKSDEGGRFSGPEGKRVNLLLRWAGEGFELVDVELSTPDVEDVIERLGETGVVTIASHHNFRSTPGIDGILEIVDRELSAGADICKAITWAVDAADNVTCLRATRLASRRARVICFAMGRLGMISRVLSPLIGGYCTYASIERGRESVAGQLTVEEMRQVYRALGCDR